MKYIKERVQSSDNIRSVKSIFISEWFHFLVLFIFSVLIVGGLYSRSVMLIAIVIISAYMIMTPTGRNIEDLFFLIAFENIFKLSASSSSIFTYIQIIPLIKLIIDENFEIKNKISFSVELIFACFLAGFSYTSMTGLIKFYIGLFLLFFLLANEDNVRIDSTKIVLKYSFGILVSSTWALSGLSVFSRYVSSLVVRLSDGSAINRFSGLWRNSNYFSIEISIALAGLAILYLKDKIKFEFFVLGIPLFVLGSMSQSKTFVLTFGVAAVLFALYLARKSSVSFVRIAIFGIGLYIIFHSRINYFLATYFTRMSEVIDDTTSIAVATTGRAGIWSRYLTETFSSIKGMLIGRGMEVSIPQFSDSHNMFLEILYTLGIVGSSIYCLAIFSLRPRKIDLKYSIIIIITFALRAFAANIAYYNNTWYYYLIIFSLMDNRDELETNISLNGKYIKDIMTV